MEPLLHNDHNSPLKKLSEPSDFSARTRASTLSTLDEVHSDISGVSLLPESDKITKRLKDKVGQAVTKSSFYDSLSFKVADKTKDLRYISYKYFILFLGVFSTIYAIQSVSHFFIYYTPFFVHILSFTMRIWDIYQLTMIFYAMQRKDVKTIKTAIRLLKVFLAMFTMFSIALFCFTNSPMAYLTGYLATSVDISGEAVMLKGRLISLFLAEEALCAFILFGAIKVKGFIEKIKDFERKEEPVDQI